MSHDVVLLGATGFAGRLTAEYLSVHAPQGLRWAVAGRDRGRLETLAAGLGGSSTPDVLTADVTDEASLRSLAEGTRVLATTVGPYVLHGGPVVAACAATGTDYCDLTGEPEFVDRSWLDHHATALRTGARLVHACGFDSVPHDLGVLATVRLLPDDVPLRVRGFVRADAEFSGGTFQSAVGAFGRLRESATVAKQRRSREERPTDRRARGISSGPVRVPGGGWGLPLPTIDPQVVLRSARALPEYGPDFSYGHYAHLRHLTTVGASVVGAGGLLAAAQVGPLRRRLLAMKAAGTGPSAERRARSSFTVRFVGEGGGREVVTEVRGGDPGYDETARMLAESAMSLALDDLPATAGQVTTAQAMGDALLGRLDFVRQVATP